VDIDVPIALYSGDQAMNKPHIKAILAWIFVVLATVGTAAIADDKAHTGILMLTAVMLIAAIKARVVIIHYMELGHAPLGWRIAFEAWIVIATVIILGGAYLGN
jgi:hypothetical protein